MIRTIKLTLRVLENDDRYYIYIVLNEFGK